MLKRTVLALVVAVALVVWVAPDVRAAAVGSRFDVTLYGFIDIFNVWRDAVASPDRTQALVAVPNNISGTSQKEGIWFMNSMNSRMGIRISGPETPLGFLGTPKTSALVEWDWRDPGSEGNQSRLNRLRAGMFDLDWAGKTVSHKLRIGLAGANSGGISFMNVGASPWFGGSSGTPFQNQVSLFHTINLDKTTALTIQWGAIWEGIAWTSPTLGGANAVFRTPWNESEQPGFLTVLTLRTVPYGKTPVLIKTDLRFNRFEQRLGPIETLTAPLTHFQGEQWIWANGFVIPTPGYEDLLWNVNFEWGQGLGATSGGQVAPGNPVIVPSALNRLAPFDVRVRRGSSWWSGVTWNATKKLTMNAAYGNMRIDPGQVPFYWGGALTAATAAQFYKEHREYAVNFWYAFTPMLTMAMQYRKYMTEYQHSGGIRVRPDLARLGGTTPNLTFSVGDGQIDEISTEFKIFF